ncbi:MAG: hypothetical protein WB952_06430 [Terriglobales bacterium]
MNTLEKITSPPLGGLDFMIMVNKADVWFRGAECVSLVTYRFSFTLRLATGVEAQPPPPACVMSGTPPSMRDHWALCRPEVVLCGTAIASPRSRQRSPKAYRIE